MHDLIQVVRAHAHAHVLGTEEAYIRFIECLVGDYLVWRCKRLGLEGVLLEMQRTKERLVQGIIPHDGWAVRGREHPQMMAWNAVRELNNAIEQVWGACAREERQSAHHHHVDGIMRRRALGFHWGAGYTITEEAVLAEDFELRSFGRWLQQL